jgi:hypothetical protein
MIAALKTKAFGSIPSVFFKVALGILTHSCTSDQAEFDQLLYMFNGSLMEIYMLADTTSLKTLFALLLEEMTAKNKLWFRRPAQVTKFLKDIYEMIKLSKVPGGFFTQRVC